MQRGRIPPALCWADGRDLRGAQGDVRDSQGDVRDLFPGGLAAAEKPAQRPLEEFVVSPPGRTGSEAVLPLGGGSGARRRGSEAVLPGRIESVLGRRETGASGLSPADSTEEVPRAGWRRVLVAWDGLAVPLEAGALVRLFEVSETVMERLGRAARESQGDGE